MGVLIFSENARKFLTGTLPMAVSIPVSPPSGQWSFCAP